MTRILIVDDNSTNLYMLETLLKGTGYEVTTAVNGREALDYAVQNPPDLIITDLLMPVMDGYTLCRRWRDSERLKHIPLVVYTATYTEPEDEKFALDLGADRFLIKPLEPEKLIAIVKEYLNGKSEVDAAYANPLGEEMEFFRHYNEILFKKLEKKVSDLEIANRNLKLMEEFYRLSFENASDVICMIDHELKILNISPSFEKILNYRTEDFVGRPVSELRTITTAESFKEIMRDVNAVLGGRTIAAMVQPFITKDGRVKFGELSGAPILRGGKIIGLISVVRDITERKQAERELENSRKLLIRSEKLAAIGQLSAGVAHEILNPIQIITMKLEMHRMRENISEKTEETLRTCEEQIGKIVKIAQDLKQLVRTSESEMKPAPVNDLIEQVLGFMKPRLHMENVRVDARYAQDLPLIILEWDRIGQVIMNLINNAIDAMEDKPKKLLSAVTERAGGNAVRLSFSDTGTGIDPEIREKIFDPFFTTKDQGKGTGLGLSISFGIVQDHGGKIWVENNDEGGATFKIELPTDRTASD